MSGIKDALSNAAEALHISGNQSAPTGQGLNLYIDEAAGSDQTGDGTKEKPYATALGALLAQGPEASLHVKKAPTAQPAAGEQPVATDTDGFAPISGAGLKKAKKFYDAEIKKRKKQEEKEQQEALKSGNDAQRLEDAKKVVLEEPKDKAEYQKVSRDTKEIIQCRRWLPGARANSAIPLPLFPRTDQDQAGRGQPGQEGQGLGLGPQAAIPEGSHLHGAEGRNGIRADCAFWQAGESPFLGLIIRRYRGPSGLLLTFTISGIKPSSACRLKPTTP